jgi:hypothetical protein
VSPGKFHTVPIGVRSGHFGGQHVHQYLHGTNEPEKTLVVFSVMIYRRLVVQELNLEGHQKSILKMKLKAKKNQKTREVKYLEKGGK